MGRDRDRDRDRSDHSNNNYRSDRNNYSNQQPSSSSSASNSSNAMLPPTMKPPSKPINVKQARADMIASQLDYTNESNPFGDSKLTDKFVWTKKIEKDLASGKRDILPPRHVNIIQQSGGSGQMDTKEQQLHQARSKVEEIAKIRKRRDERFQEQQEIEKQRDELEREKAQEESRMNQQREDEFQYRQQLEKANIRVQQKRENLIDLLVISLLLTGGDGSSSNSNSTNMGLIGENMGNMDLSEEVLLPDQDPIIKIRKQYPLEKLQQLKQEILNVDDVKNPDYWDSLLLAVEGEIDIKQKNIDNAKKLQEQMDRNRLIPQNHLSNMDTSSLSNSMNVDGSNKTKAESEVDKEVQEMLEEQGLEELLETEQEIKNSLAAAEDLENNDGDGEDVDVEFYSTVLEKIPLYRARRRVSFVHEVAVQRAKEKGCRIRYTSGDITGVMNYSNNHGGSFNDQGHSAAAAAAKEALLQKRKRDDRKAEIEGSLKKEGIIVITERDEKRMKEEEKRKRREEREKKRKEKGVSDSIKTKEKEKLEKEKEKESLGLKSTNPDQIQKGAPGSTKIIIGDDGKMIDAESDDDSSSSEESDQDKDKNNNEKQSLDNDDDMDSDDENEIPSLSPRLLPLDRLTVTLITDERTGTQTKIMPLVENIDYNIITQEQEEEDRKRNRQRLLERFGGEVDEKGDDWVDMMKRKAGMQNGEQDFNSYDGKTDHGLINIERTVHYDWERKYKPRKPRYFNRVKTGFSWNKYNSTHYDHEVPPPKIVQGYRFNIFYPDLLDKTSTPKYFLEKSNNVDINDPDAENDTVLLRFSAGPPYDDLCFKIVNREWNTNTRRGFRCVFDRGVLQLYFNFKGYTYRR